LWTDYGGGPAHRGSSAGAAPTPPLHTEWSAPLFDTEFSGPLVVGSEVYVVDSRADGAHLLGLRLNDGSVTFDILLGTDVPADITYDSGLIFVDDQSRGQVEALDAGTGAVRWV